MLSLRLGMNSLFINNFLPHIRRALRKIAYETKGEISLGDLESDAFLLSLEFVEKHSRKLTKDDAGWIIGRLRNKHINWADYKFRNAVRLEGLENEEGGNFVLDLPAPSSSNPLIEILDKEELLEHQELFINSYSEAKAYVISFINFNYDKILLSSYFFITSDTLNCRIDRAISILRYQPSLFDAIEVIDESFIPRPGKEKPKMAHAIAKQQLTLTLDTVAH